MTAYVIILRETPTAPDILPAYQMAAAAARVQHPLKIISRYGPHFVLEGDEVDGIVLLQFPSVADARAWYDSDAYQNAKRIRAGSGNYRFMVVEAED